MTNFLSPSGMRCPAAIVGLPGLLPGPPNGEDKGKDRKTSTSVWRRGPSASPSLSWPQDSHSILLAPSCGRASSSTSISSTGVAASGAGLAGGEGAAAPSLRRGGGGGDLHPLAACLVFFFGRKFGCAVCRPRQLGHLATSWAMNKGKQRKRSILRAGQAAPLSLYLRQVVPAPLSSRGRSTIPSVSSSSRDVRLIILTTLVSRRKVRTAGVAVILKQRSDGGRS